MTSIQQKAFLKIAEAASLVGVSQIGIDPAQFTTKELAWEACYYLSTHAHNVTIILFQKGTDEEEARFVNGSVLAL